MRRTQRLTFLLMVLTALAAALDRKSATAAEPPFDHKKDVVYGRKHGMALTMDVFMPMENAKGLQ